jgi:hypothetical protein
VDLLPVLLDVRRERNHLRLNMGSGKEGSALAEGADRVPVLLHRRHERSQLELNVLSGMESSRHQSHSVPDATSEIYNGR